MGQKINPISNRLGIIRSWDSRWFTAPVRYAEFLHEDIELRRLIGERFFHAGIARIVVERASNRCKITISTARPGIIIGRKGSLIKTIGKEARLEIQDLLQASLYLDLQIKVKKRWRDSADVLDLIEGQ